MSADGSDSSDSVPIRQLPVSERTQQLIDAFTAKFKKTPDFFVRVPGRVNLIGEHIDYCGYGVCPMALDQDILLAVSTENHKFLYLYNTDPDFIKFECALEGLSITLDDGPPKWYQYFLCGVKGVLDILSKGVAVKGMNVLINGTVPQSAGLSSSSALVSAAALATAYANKLSLSKQKLANLCAQCERYIGTEGGGMDQAIAFLASEGCAKYIEFSPLRSSDIILPKGAVFVIAHSLAKLNKATTADFNCRVVECRLAAQIIAKKKGVKWESIKKLKDLQHYLSAELSEMIYLVEQILHKEPYTKEEIIRELETTCDYLENMSLTLNTRHIDNFKLQQRALHVFQEASRVQRFNDVCSSKLCGEGSLKALGQLMTESHESLRDLYECSHPQLDRLVDLARDLSLGCRLTGAGWGGCVVALVQSENVNKFISKLNENFYKQFEQDTIESVLFTTSPKAGACIYTNRI